MANTREQRIDERLEKMSTLFEHSDGNEQTKSKVIELETAKRDILDELPAEIRFQALQNGMSLEDLRALYADVKADYYAQKLEFQGSKSFHNGRRQDNVREYEMTDKDRQRQNEYSRTRSRSYDRGVRARA